MSLSKSVNDPFRPHNQPAQWIYDGIVAEAAKRATMVPTTDWLHAKRMSVYRLVREYAQQHGLRAPTLADIARAETVAIGHVDYAAKWAYAISDLLTVEAAVQPAPAAPTQTPITDAAVVDAAWILASHSGGAFVPAHVSRDLELELVETKASKERILLRAENIRNSLVQAEKERDQLREKVATLEARLNQASRTDAAPES